MRYWFFEVELQGQVTSTAQFIQLFVQRFRTDSQVTIFNSKLSP